MSETAGEQTFSDFVLAHESGLLKFAMVLTGDYRMTEDVVADVLARLFEQWDRVGSMADPLAYVRKMIVHEHISWRRRWTRARPTPPESLNLGSAAPASDRLADREDVVNRLASLSPRQRAVIVLRFYEDMSDDQIARVLGCRAATVRGHASRAMSRLRLNLADDNDADSLPLGRPYE